MDRPRQAETNLRQATASGNRLHGTNVFEPIPDQASLARGWE
jgi:hypothetical protein